MQEELAHCHAQAPPAASDHPPAPMPSNMEGIIWAHLIQLQVDPNFVELLQFQ